MAKPHQGTGQAVVRVTTTLLLCYCRPPLSPGRSGPPTLAIAQPTTPVAARGCGVAVGGEPQRVLHQAWDLSPTRASTLASLPRNVAGSTHRRYMPDTDAAYGPSMFVFAYIAAGLVVLILLVILAAVGFDKGMGSRAFIVFEVLVALIMFASSGISGSDH